MAFVSELNFLGSGAGEFIEIVLAPGDDPADFTVSAYNQNGVLWPNAGLPGGEVTLDSLTGSPDPEHPNFIVYVIPVGVRNANSDSNEASGIALTDTSAGGGVISFYSADNLSPITATQGAASGATSSAELEHTVLVSGQSYQWDIFGNRTFDTISSGNAVLCISSEALIETSQGMQPAGQLTPGDEVWTLDNGYQPLRWIGSTKVDANRMQDNPHLVPISFAVGSLGEGMPREPLAVSRQHRMLVRSPIAERMFGSAEVLLPAIRLEPMPGIKAVQNTTVTYCHLLFEDHQIIRANGALVESLLIADMSQRVLMEAHTRSFEVPVLPVGLQGMKMRPARPVIEQRKARTLVARMIKNGRSPVESTVQDRAERRKQVQASKGATAR